MASVSRPGIHLLKMTNPRMKNLIAALLKGDCPESVVQARKLIGDGAAPEEIVVGGVEAAMQALDSKCTLEQFNLLEIMLAGRAVTEVMKDLFPDGEKLPSIKGKILVASLEGDIHDLGKNILKMVLTGKGYDVVDCGKDCPLEKLIDITGMEQPAAVAVSGLITSVIPLVRQVRPALRQRGLDRVKVLAGGAALKQSSAAQLDVDYVAESAFDILHYLDETIEAQP